jgi:hypothetical protein
LDSSPGAERTTAGRQAKSTTIPSKECGAAVVTRIKLRRGYDSFWLLSSRFLRDLAGSGPR